MCFLVTRILDVFFLVNLKHEPLIPSLFSLLLVSYFNCISYIELWYSQGANFRSLPGVIVKEDNTVALDPDVERVFLPSGKPLVCTIS